MIDELIEELVSKGIINKEPRINKITEGKDNNRNANLRKTYKSFKRGVKNEDRKPNVS